MVIFLTGSVGAGAQVRFSVAPDLSLMRNFSPRQKFWTLGGTLQANLHFNKKQSAYAWINYYAPARFKNNFTALAKSPNTSPSAITFRATATWTTDEVSLGWKHFFKGSFDAETGWNLYGLVGFGFLFTRVENSFSKTIDTSLYLTSVRFGSGQFNRLSLDLGAGVEFALGGNFFLYGEERTWLPASDYPSPYLHRNQNVPLAFSISGGIRILFGY